MIIEEDEFVIEDAIEEEIQVIEQNALAIEELGDDEESISERILQKRKKLLSK